MITARRMQSDFADLWIHETVQELWEPWMRHAHKALRDDNLVDLVEAELNQRCAKSKTRGRPSYPVEVVLSMLLLKHLRDMSFARTVVREVRGNLVYRQFTGIGGGTVPDEKTLGRVARQLGPKAMKRIQARMVEIARQEGVIEGVRVRMDTTVIPLSSGKPARQWKQLNRMIPLVEQVMRQARARVLEGNTRSEGKIVSLFEPHTAVIRKGKASKPTEFGNLVLLVEAENQIVTTYRICEGNPADATLLIEGLESHTAVMGRAPKLLAADSGFFSAANEKRAIELGVGQVAIPLKGSKSTARLKKQKTRWFKNAQRWRTGCEGRISVLKRRHGLHRCRYKGPSGMERWVGWGIIADNFTNIGCHLAGQEEAAARAARQQAAAAPR